MTIEPKPLLLSPKTLSKQAKKAIQAGLRHNYANRLLVSVMNGMDENDLVAIIQARPEFMLNWDNQSHGIATDEAGRVVFGPALHYALWAGDWYHVQKFKDAMSQEQFQNSIEAYKNNGGLGILDKPGYYGKAFNYQPVLLAYQNCKVLTEKMMHEDPISNSSHLQLHALWRIAYTELANCPNFFIQQITTPTLPLSDEHG